MKHFGQHLDIGGPIEKTTTWNTVGEANPGPIHSNQTHTH
jgi:hypothetical protein